MKSHLTRPNRPAALWQRLVASGCLGLVLVLNLLAAAPQVHTWLHEAQAAAGHGDCEHSHGADAVPAGQAEHDDDGACVITQFANGQVGCEAAVVVVSATLLREVAVLPDRVAALSGRPDLKLPPGCGPPLV